MEESKISDVPPEASGLRRVIDVTFSHVALVSAIVITGSALALAFWLTSSRSYSASAEVSVLPAPQGAPFSQLSFLSAETSLTRDVETLAQAANSNDVAALAAKSLGQTDTTRLARAVSAQPIGQSYTVRITATSTSATGAARIANAFAAQTVTRMGELFRASVAAAIQQEKAQEASATTKADRQSIQVQLTALDALKDADSPTIQVFARATTPTSPSSPGLILVLIAGILGAGVLGVGVALVVDALDDRVRRESEVIRAFGAPVLARFGMPISLEGAITAMAPLGQLLAPPDPLPRARAKPKPRTVVFAGLVSEDPAGLCAIATAQALARAGVRVLLVRPAGGTLPEGLDETSTLILYQPETKLASSQGLLRAVAAEAVAVGAALAVVDVSPLGGEGEGLAAVIRADEQFVVVRSHASRHSDVETVAERLHAGQIAPRGIVAVAFPEPGKALGR